LLRPTAVQKQAIPRRALAVLTLMASALVVAFTFASSASATTADCLNPATLGGSAFEIDTDANLVVNTTGCIDWLTGGTGTPFRDGVLAKNDKPTGANDDSFGKGTAEDNPNPTIVTGSIPPNKSDLKAFGVYTEDVASTTNDFLELFWSRVQSPQGTTNMDFELNQKFCDPTATPTNCADNGSGVTPETPLRTTGDKLITYDLSRGGTVPAISIRTWTGTAWGPATVISGGSSPSALGSVNTSTIPANQTGGVSGGLTTALGSQDPFTFGEAAISFEALFGTGACGTFGSAYLKSRSSDSFTSEIKDFVAPERVRISNCPSGLTTTATASVIVGNPISDTAHLDVGTVAAGGTITFHLWSDAGCLNEVSTGLSPVAVNGSGDYNSGDFTPLLVGTYYWTADYSGDAAHSVDPSSTACGDPNETTVVVPITSTISTHQSVIPNDAATITGGGSGTVRFRLFSGTTCDGTAVYDETRPVSSSGTAATTNTTVSVDASGTYSWLVEYTSSDTNHTDATSTCSTEHFAITFTNG
jgi:hypothetical protein